jgi:prepilin-type N-terminal cleavage/methylation domain-containing protein
MRTKNKRGFTLIEVIIYIALFSVLLGTAFVTAYELIQGSDSLSTKNTTASEGSFVIRKLNWVLTKYDGDISNFRLNDNKIEVKESTEANTFLPITTDNVTVGSLLFTYLPPSGGAPSGITATFVMNGTTFTTTKYLRK